MSRHLFLQNPAVAEAGNEAFKEAYDEFVKNLEPAEARARANDVRLEAQREALSALTAGKEDDET